MVIERQNSVGIDAVVQSIQRNLGKVFTDYDIFPRCYPILRDNIKNIEYYTGNGNDYRNLIYAEKQKCFFTHTYDVDLVNPGFYTTKLDLYFTVKLNSSRNDAEIHNKAVNALKGVNHVRINRIITGIERVFNGYSYRITDDMQPWHCFRIVLDVISYRLDQKNC